MIHPGPQATLLRPFRLRPGQILLVVLVVAAIIMQIAWSFLATRAHEIERATVFAEEADATAMTFVQRESFNTLLLLERWATGEVSARDVQIARANLGQRLGVRVSSGAVTADIVQEEYRQALTALDEHLLRLGDVTDADRRAFRGAIADDVESFLGETRALSRVFQALTREQVTEVLEDRAEAERLQALLGGLILVLGMALAVWLARDISDSYRVSRARLAEERDQLEQLRRRFTAVQLIGQAATGWREQAERVAHGDELFDRIRADLDRYVPDLAITIEPDAAVPVTVIPRDEGHHDPDDIAYVTGRVTDAVQAWISRERARAALEHERVHDALTGLPNRLRLPELVDECGRRHAYVGLAVLDIDRFTDLNGAFGEAAGDRVLCALAEAITPSEPHSHGALRLASDDFAIVVGGATEDDVRWRLSEVIKRLPPAVSVERGIAPLSVSVGVAIVPPTPTVSIDAILARSLAALQVSRASVARNSVVVFDETQHSDLLVSVTEEAEFREAVVSGDVYVVLQPIVNLRTGRPVGMEALARWRRGDTVVTPDRFLPIVSRAGLFTEFSTAISNSALRAWRQVASTWSDAAGGDPPYISINVHPSQLETSQFVDWMSALAREHDVPTESIVCEITEDAVVNATGVLDVLTALRGEGFRIAVDDFGTGYSSLGQAISLPLDILKIDRSFISSLDLSDSAGGLFRDLVGIGRTLGAVLVAEGVESAEVAVMLSELGVDCAQGFHFARPMPVDDVIGWFDAQQGRSVAM